MSSKTKIVVLHMKEVIYTGIFLLLLVILGVVMFLMFGSGKSKTASSDAVSKYTPGIYRTSIRLNLYWTLCPARSTPASPWMIWNTPVIRNTLL